MHCRYMKLLFTDSPPSLSLSPPPSLSDRQRERERERFNYQRFKFSLQSTFQLHPLWQPPSALPATPPPTPHPHPARGAGLSVMVAPPGQLPSPLISAGRLETPSTWRNHLVGRSEVEAIISALPPFKLCILVFNTPTLD